jgi:hypothetical protein
MIVDIRDYATTKGNRDKLIERCETVFWDEQERLGARFLGGFRDAEDEDRFLFVRAMPDLETRKRVMTAFYTDGEMWRTQRDEVNSWIADSDNVLLVRPVSEIAPSRPGDSVVAMVSRVGKEPVPDALVAEWREKMGELIGAAGGRLLVTFRVDQAENNYPRHPIREGEHGLVWFATFAARPAVSLRAGVGAEVRWLHPIRSSRLR